jgi:stress-induced morphogen
MGLLIQDLIDLLEKGLTNPLITMKDLSSLHQKCFGPGDGIPSHLQITIVCGDFEGMSLIDKHRCVNNLLKPAFDAGLHSASLVLSAQNSG